MTCILQGEVAKIAHKGKRLDLYQNPRRMRTAELALRLRVVRMSPV